MDNRSKSLFIDDESIKLAVIELPTQFSKVLMELEMKIA